MTTPTGVRTDPEIETAAPATPRRPQTPRVLVIAISTAVIVVVAGALLVPGLFSLGPGPSDFAPAGIDRASPGTLGCLPNSAEVCFTALLESSISGLTLTHLRFVVANGSANATTNGPLAPPLPLGVGAQITALASTSSVVGVWNVSDGHWVSGGEWPVPTGSSLAIALDTGLVSTHTLGDAELWVVLTSPYAGSVGFPLFCGGC